MAVRVDPLLSLRPDTDFTVLTMAPELGGVAPPLRPQGCGTLPVCMLQRSAQTSADPCLIRRSFSDLLEGAAAVSSRLFQVPEFRDGAADAATGPRVAIMAQPGTSSSPCRQLACPQQRGGTRIGMRSRMATHRLSHPVSRAAALCCWPLRAHQATGLLPHELD